MPIERGGRVVLRIDHEGKHNYLRTGCPHRGVGKQRAARTLAVEGTVNREAADARHRHRGITRQALGEAGRQLRKQHAVGRQGVVAGYLAAADVHRHIAGTHAPPDILADLASEVAVERLDAGESNAEIARRLGMYLTTVAHHLSLLDLPPALDQALRTGRCTSPRTLHELSKLHETEPDRVRALVDSDVEITRAAVAQIKADDAAPAAPSKPGKQADAIARAHVACDRLERALARVARPAPFTVALPDLVALRIRVEDIGRKWPWGRGGLTVRPHPPTLPDRRDDDGRGGAKEWKAG
jgi:hypothetical protein